jgi:hypothetical protein
LEVTNCLSGMMLSFSGNVHFQDSRYGTTSYIANQKLVFYNDLG